MALLREHQEADALTAVDLVLKDQPGNLQAYCLKADILDEQHQWQRAIDVLTELVEQHPKFHYGQLRLAKAYVSVEQLDAALEHARAALRLAPDHPETLEFAATLPGLSQDDRTALKVQVSKAIGVPSDNREGVATLHFAAASLARHEGDTTQEMGHLNEGHSLLREGLRELEGRSERDCCKRLAAPLLAAPTGPRPDIPRPIFVVGQPRSGTTLVERILSAHSNVQGLGELAAVHHWARKAEARPSDWQDAQKLVDFYVGHLPDLSEGSATFVDKAPGNYALLGAIAQAFPEAVILNVERDPRDVALSMWRTHFGAAGLHYTHDLKWMAAEANRYRRYILHWQQELPGRIHSIRYENLVENLRDAANELARLSGVGFEDGMLSPQASSEAVRTASNLQIRKPVNTSSIGRWHTFADQLAPFVKGLEPDLWPEIQAADE
ncbi:sulfotransferase [Ruegeria sp. A3M17]|uniref:tetratricopeptide repeat-containing sulfotransferase family protein n=1 Tax=Ruegeria sp. A3M17 TaxID=2267229 RepID=UPI0011BE5283|nr:sulfotransferase [Ruegeria sp. A3M17]